mmetsp:Transcript_60120/g.175672  ORF Transcript_60120/g.175672 Transcript_60120/m.175672 type:complete len:411 (+) Transcript_60120:1620-2852(+)
MVARPGGADPHAGDHRGLHHRHEGHQPKLLQDPEESHRLRASRQAGPLDAQHPGWHAVHLAPDLGHRDGQPRGRQGHHRGPAHHQGRPRPLLLRHGLHVRAAPGHREEARAGRPSAPPHALRRPHLALAHDRERHAAGELLHQASDHGQGRWLRQVGRVDHRQRRPQDRVPPRHRHGHGHRLEPRGVQGLPLRQDVGHLHAGGVHLRHRRPAGRLRLHGRARGDHGLQAVHVPLQHGAEGVHAREVHVQELQEPRDLPVLPRAPAQLPREVAGRGRPRADARARPHAGLRAHRLLPPEARGRLRGGGALHRGLPRGGPVPLHVLGHEPVGHVPLLHDDHRPLGLLHARVCLRPDLLPRNERGLALRPGHGLRHPDLQLRHRLPAPQQRPLQHHPGVGALLHGDRDVHVRP